MSTFTKGLGVFWRTELRLVAPPLAAITSARVMAVALILVVGGAFILALTDGLWLFRAPVHPPMILVWMARGAALMWIFYLAYAFYRHIMRLGNAG
ncbi:hypothetical protein [Acidithiobacillus ferrooxidans]|uniref:Uncharacterized protein n=2 Tax=Acidithiobacillus ferrooxidans TaxID=920 RepID=A0A2W1KHD3_ACIFR|nr:hypothetical protein [Acidithiobacillus ferrooxidans]MBU2817574.1 hypothetical protein [Acidithiobacillus ferrooxidans]MCR1341788.1 hypothetical protein [Acidithiobacillus ferrooxidans]PZD81812.1 hypothetical protein DN052_01680 [Acidithiobacillus ferrooxidans]QLK41895.1 hypothetical protein FE661_06810 [Acidithiobacillus ferrooxidans]QZT53858.1 hypothetical protein K7B00_06795 [Acidithiobacillus ferrooxidans]